jgi:acetyl esterase/lipase
MNKLSKILYLLLLAGFTGTAVEWHNIPYYEENAPIQGNTEYAKERCKLDVKTPEGKKEFPTLIWFHGGGIVNGEKYFPHGIPEDRIALVTVNYRLSGKGAKCPDYLYDAAASVAWVLNHIKEFGGDPGKVYVSGHSAGGYLAAMIALDSKYLKAFEKKNHQLAGVFPISGQMTTHFQVLNERRKEIPDTAEIMIDEYAPLFHAGKNKPPLILLVGDSEIEWPARVEENLLLAARLKRNFNDQNVRCLALPACNHETVAAPALLIIKDMILNTAK